MKKIILIVVGVIFIALLGRLGWAFWQVRSDEGQKIISQAEPTDDIKNLKLNDTTGVPGSPDFDAAPNRESWADDPEAFVVTVGSSSTIAAKKYVSATSKSSTVIASAPTAKLTVNGVTNTSVKVGDNINLAWSATNADSFYSVSSTTGCLNVDMNKTTPPDTHITARGSSSGLDTWASEIQGCTVTITYTAKNSKTGETAKSTITVKVN